jgi:hypothetical protein
MRVVVEQRAREYEAIRARRGVGFFDVYRTLAEIEAHFDALVLANPNVISQVNVGTSIQGRTIWGYRILAPDAVADPVRVVINGTQHAREWLSPMTNTYIATELVNDHGVSQVVTDMLRQVEIVIIPVVNPDGYVYSHTTERFWRKNRRNNGGSFGVDLNRNWGYEWNGGQSGSSSSSPSSDIYRGTAPFSEPETAAVSAFIASLSDVRGHIDFHTYGQWILGPWGYNDTFAPPRASEHRTAQNEMAASMQAAEGLTYVAGLGTDQLLYTADGIMPDWTFGDQGALSWTIELRPTGGGLGPFDPPPSNILPASKEGLAALMKLAEIAQRELDFRFPADRPVAYAADTGETFPVTLFRWHELPVVPGSVRIATRDSGAGAFTETALSGSGDNYTAELPIAPCGSTVEYYFLADLIGGGTVLEPADAPGSVYTAEAVEFVDVAANDFESDPSWVLSGSPNSGAWVRAVPGNFGQADPPSDSDGSGHCYVTGNSSGETLTGTTVLTTPPYDISQPGTLTYDYWLKVWGVGNGSTSGGDALRLEYATNAGGTNWTLVRNHNTVSSVWNAEVLQIGTGGDIPSSPTLRFRFSGLEAQFPTPFEVGIDSFQITAGTTCAPVACLGDANGDSTVDVNDISFVLFRLGDPCAAPGCDGDANGDGVVDVNDISYVLFRLGDTCP